MKSDITRGQSIIFHEYYEKNRTCIRGNEANLLQYIEGFDGNALYQNARMEPMASDFIRHKQNGFKVEGHSLYTAQNRQWLSWVLDSKNSLLQTQYKGREMALGKRRLRVDGWDAGSRTV